MRNKDAGYARLRENAPVTARRVSLLRVTRVSRSEDGRFVLTDGRFGRNHARSIGRSRGGALPIPLPKVDHGAVDELVRRHGPLLSTKPVRPIEDVEIAGVRIPQYTPILPVLGAANRDPASIEIANWPGWHRHTEMPVVLG